MTDAVNNYLFIFIMGLISIALPMLVFRRNVSQVYLMLALFLVLGTLANCLPVLIELFPNIMPYSLAIVIPSYIIQPVSLWFYVKGLCSATKWDISKNRFVHYILPLLSLIYALIIVISPTKEINILFDNTGEELSSLSEFIAITTFILMLVWLVQSCIYMVLIFRRLIAYRLELKQLFASTDNTELAWLFGVISALAITWLLAFFAITLGFIGSGSSPYLNWLPLSYLVLVWIFSYWGLRQKPGFNNRYINEDELNQVLEDVVEKNNNEKYTRSGLNQEKSKNIAAKIEKQMTANKLYLKAELTLSMLAKDVSEKPNYVSQALNQILARSFFDYVNGFRIEYSKKLILESKLSVLEIALASGFNAKSSFYKAFKKETGLTPKQLLDASHATTAQE